MKNCEKPQERKINQKKIGNMKQISFIFGIVIAFWSHALFAQNHADINVTVELDPDTILMDNVFYLSYNIEGADGKFEMPDFKDFDVVSQSSGSSISIVNGEASRTMSYTFALRPHEPGSFVIDPALIRTKDGEVVETSPIEIVVYPNPEGRHITPRRMEQIAPFGHDLFKDMDPFHDDFFGFERRERAPEKGKKKAPKAKKKRYKF